MTVVKMIARAGLFLLCCLVPATAGAVDYANFSDDGLGFSFQVPRAWLPPQASPPAALIFSGPQGSPQYYTTINVQLLLAPNSDIQAQAQEFILQMARAPRYRLLTRQSGNLAGQRGLRFVVEYQLPGTGQLFRQEQYIVQRPPYFFWMAYTAPLDIFEQHQVVMDRAVSTLAFQPLAALQPAGQPEPSASLAPAPAKPAGPAPRLFDLCTAKGIGEQGPLEVTGVFAPDTPRIHVWFRFEGLAAGVELRSEWFYGLKGQDKKVADLASKVQDPARGWGQFSIAINPGSRFPAGQYRVDIYQGRQLLGSADFQVR